MSIAPSIFSTLPETPGVYRFYNSAGKIIYIGKAINLRKRVSSYFQKNDHEAKTSQMVLQIDRIEITSVDSEFEALLLEAALIKRHLPKYNVIWKDDKHYIYIKITRETYPRILFSRREEGGSAAYFGPFPSKRVVRGMLTYIRSIIPYCSQNRNNTRPCFYTHIGLCDPCPAAIRPMLLDQARTATQRYQEHIRRIKTLLSGNIESIRRLMTREMTDAANRQSFEEATGIRDRLRTLEYLVRQYHAPEEYMQNPKLVEAIRAAEAKELRDLLLPYYPSLGPIRRIECYDISNTSGTLATGSMVTFSNGEPDKDYYRRFRIRTKTTPDDFAMMREMLARRLRHTDWPAPDLLVIDGGAPQLRALKTVLDESGMRLPVIGLAKQEEELVIPKGETFVKIDLPSSSSALHLVQRLRDEAHRFARSYHHLLRKKEVFGN